MPYLSAVFYGEHAKSLKAMIAVLGVPPMQMDDDLHGTSASFATANYFSELGTPAAVGRLFDPARESEATAPPVVVLSYTLWQHRFNGDPGVVGRTVKLNRKPATVIGVTPYEFASLGGQTPDLWIPMAQQPYFVTGSTVLTDPGASSVRMWGRLAPGVTAKMAAEELKALTNELRRQYPKDIWDGEYIDIHAGGHLQVMQPAMYRVAAMVALLTLLILAVACANLGGLLLARAVTSGTRDGDPHGDWGDASTNLQATGDGKRGAGAAGCNGGAGAKLAGTAGGADEVARARMAERQTGLASAGVHIRDGDGRGGVFRLCAGTADCSAAAAQDDGSAGVDCCAGGGQLRAADCGRATGAGNAACAAHGPRICI